MSNAWYEEVAATAAMMQGDLISNCPLLSWQTEATSLNGENDIERLQKMANAIEADTVVMTQACDLANEKIQNVVLCPHLSARRQNWTARGSRRATSIRMSVSTNVLSAVATCFQHLP